MESPHSFSQTLSPFRLLLCYTDAGHAETVFCPAHAKPMHQSPSRWHLHLIVLALYSVLALVLSWPLLAKIAVAVPGVPQWAFDESTFLWNTWYLKHALVDNLSTPLHTDLIWYPLGIDLVLYTYNFYHALIAQPLMLAVNLPFASNIALLAGTTLSGYGVFLLVLYLLGTRTAQSGSAALSASARSLTIAAFGAGLLYAFASNRAIYATLGHYDMVTTQWIPFYALALLRSLDHRLEQRARLRSAGLAGLFLALNGLAEMITALFLGIFTIIVLASVLVDSLRSSDSAHPKPSAVLNGLLAAGAVIGTVTFVVWSPVLVPILIQFFTDDFSLQGWGEAIPLSTDLLGWFTPTVLHPVFGGDLVAELRRVQLRALDMGVTGFRDVNTVFLGWVSLGLAAIGAAVYRSRVRIWIWTVIIFGLFTLGPFLQINGRYRFDLDGVEATVPLPFALLHYLPIIKANRAPNRNSVMLMLGLAVLAAYALYWLQLRIRRRNGSHAWQTALAAALCLLIIFEHLALPLPLSNARVPALYDTIAADPRPVSVLHTPLGWRNSFGVYGPERTQLQYYQTAHAKPMLGGNISRAPDFKMEYFRRIPYFQALTDIQFGRNVAPETLAAAEAQAEELMYLYNTAYVVLMPPIPQRFPYADHWQDAWTFVKRTLPLEPAPFYTEDGIEAYRVVQPPGEDRFRLDLGIAGTYPYRGEGWDTAEADSPYDTSANWAVGSESRLFLPLRELDPDSAYEFSARIHPFTYPGSTIQTVSLRINDMEIDSAPLSHSLQDDWQTVTWAVPGDILIDGLNRLTLEWGYAASPRTVIPGDRTIGTTGFVLPVDADLKAFADGGFIALFDENGEQEDASAGRRGVNVTVLDAESGEVLSSAGFDTASNSYESQALAEMLAQIEPGHPVLIASSGDAGAFLTQEAVEALRALGADVSLQDLQGNYFAIVGVTGAEPGSALTAIDPGEAFLRVSLNRDRRELAAAVDWVEIRPAP